MAVSFGGHTFGNYNDPPAKPSGLANGDVLVLCLCGFYDKDASASLAGFTKICDAPGEPVGDREFLTVLAKVITNAAGEPSTYTPSYTGAGGDVLPITYYARGCDITSGLTSAIAGSSVNSNAGGSLAMPSVTAPSGGAAATLVGSSFDQNVWNAFGTPVTITPPTFTYVTNSGPGAASEAQIFAVTSLSAGSVAPTASKGAGSGTAAMIVFAPGLPAGSISANLSGGATLSGGFTSGQRQANLTAGATMSAGLTSRVAIAAALAAGATLLARPDLPVNTWTQLMAPPSTGAFTQSMVRDPTTPNTLYCCWIHNTATDTACGVWKSTDAGATWTRMSGPGLTGPGQPINIVFPDSTNGQLMFVSDGVRGSTMGLWKSTDGGVTWSNPGNFMAVTPTSDTYHVAADPNDPNHLLVSFHSPWTGQSAPGVMETTDGGTTWTAKNVPGITSSAGVNVDFLCHPGFGIGNSNTWIYGSQDAGRWRTTNGGTSWTQVSTDNMDHGGQQIAYTANGDIYISGAAGVARSTDGGATWTNVGPSASFFYLSCVSDGSYIYTALHSPGNCIRQAIPATSTSGWSNVGTKTFSDGSFCLIYDAASRRLYNASTGEGLWAYQFPAPAGGISANLGGGATVGGALGKLLACAAVAGAMCAGALTGRTALTAGPTSGAIMAPALTGRGALAAALTEGATCAGLVTGKGTLASSLTAGAVCAGQILAVKAIVAALSATATCSPALTGRGALATALASGATVSGLLVNGVGLSANLAAGAVCSPALTGRGAVAAACSGSASVAGAVSGSGGLASGLSGSAAAAGALTGIAPLSAPITAGETTSANVTGRGALGANCTAGATLVGSTGGTAPIAANLAQGATAAGAVTGSGVLGANCTGSALLTGNGGVTVPLAASLSAGESTTGALTGKGALGATCSGGATLVGVTGGTVPLTANLTEGATASGVIRANGSLSATVTAGATCSGQIVNSSTLVANLGTGASCAGTLSGSAALSASADAGASIAGLLRGTASCGAGLTAGAACAGTPSATGAASASLSGSAQATAVAQGNGGVVAALGAGAFCTGTLDPYLFANIGGGATCSGVIENARRFVPLPANRSGSVAVVPARLTGVVAKVPT